MLKTVFFIAMLVSLGACSSKMRSTRVVPEECAVHTYALWPLGSDTPSVTIIENAWYRDSIGISQVCSLATVESDSTSTTKVFTIGFRFFDLKNKWIYEYRNFSDTALPMRQFLGSDTSTIPGGWNFIRPIFPPVETLTQLPDTVIGNIWHKKYQIVFTANGYRSVSIGLFRCDIQSTIFNIHPALSQRVGCPMVAVRILPIGTNGLGSTQQITVNSNRLTDSVRKVFDAWIQNEKRYPIQ